MTARARTAALIAMLFAVLLGSSLAAPAQGAPYTGSATLGVSESNPCRHGAVTLTGSGYVAGSTVVLTIGDVVIGRATVGSDGTFSVKVTLPEELTGARTITATGASGGRIATTQITIKDCGNGGTDPGGNGAGAGGAHNGGTNTGSSDGGLSATGVAVVSLLVVAVVLIAAGLVLVLGGRRRRTSAGTA